MTVVVPVRDDPSGLALALSGLALQTSKPDQILIVDAGEGEAILPTHAPEGIQVLRVGPAFPGAARNHGAQAARHAWIAFLDAGTCPVPRWLEAFRAAVDTNSQAGLIYGSYVPRLRDDWDWAAAAIYLEPGPGPDAGRHPTSASLCVQRDVWQELGGMRSDLRAGEDLLFFREVRRLGIPVAIADEAMVSWDLPRGAVGHFQRLRRYSRATWGTDLAAHWQSPLLRMYLLSLLATVAAFAVQPALLGFLPTLVAFRIIRNYRRRRAGLPGRLSLNRLGCLLLLFILADLATLLGVWDSLQGEGRPPVKAG